MDFRHTNEDNRRRWEANADYWDAQMGEQSNHFHRFLVCPATERFLDIKAGDKVLDIACGNGNFSKRLAEKGAFVKAFDFSVSMIEHAKKRCAAFLDRIDFSVCDATDYRGLKDLKQDEPFDKAVSNMAVMDLSDINPLIKAVYKLIRKNGVFVFSAHHPCFIQPEGKYTAPYIYDGVAIEESAESFV